MRQWALTVCTSCLLVGALEMILPPKSSGKSIKTVLTLYILLSVLGFGTKKEFVPMPNLEMGKESFDYSDFTDQITQKACEAQLEQVLFQKGVEGQVEVHGDTVRCISDSPEQAETVLMPLLGPNAELEIRKAEE